MHSIIIHLFFCLLGLSGSLFTPVLAADSTASPPLQCPAQPGLGPACAAADSPWLLALAGNPINLINGNKYTLHEDLPALAQAPVLFMQRHYNAQSVHHSILGRNWSLHWDIRLQPQRQRLLLADGRHLSLQAHQLRPLQQPEAGFEVLLSPENTLRFNAAGYLIGWHKAPHEALQLHRFGADHPLLPHGLQALQVGTTRVQLQYHRPFGSETTSPVLLRAVQGPFGRIDYEYEWLPKQQQARLHTVAYPDGRRLHYHYEHPDLPFALTGVSRQLHPQHPPLRMQYWWYDPRGRAIYSARGDGQQWIRIDYTPAEMRTLAADGPHTATSAPPIEQQRVVHSAQGQSRFFFQWHQGQWRLSRSQGPQCAGCPPTDLRVDLTDDAGSLYWPGVRWQSHADGGRSLEFLTTDAENDSTALQLDFDAQGRVQAWHSPLTGRTRITSPPHQRSVQIEYANGDLAHLQRDAQGRPQRVLFSRGATRPQSSDARLSEPAVHSAHSIDSGHLTYSSHQAQTPHQDASLDESLRDDLNAPITVYFDGLDTQRLAFHHPHESQWWVLGPQRQLRQRSVHRHLETAVGPLHWTFEDRFDYNDAGQLITHHLFEGGSVHYEYDADQQPTAIYWQPAQGPRQKILQIHDRHLWEHHNGIFDLYGLEDTTEHLLLFNDQHIFSWHAQQMRAAANSQVPQVVAQHAFWHPLVESAGASSADASAQWLSQYYLHDEQGRLVGTRRTDTDWQYWAWDGFGQNIAPTTPHPHADAPRSLPAQTPSDRDASGLLLYWRGTSTAKATSRSPHQASSAAQVSRRLFYNAQRRLAAVMQEDTLLAHYRHDAFGQRIYAHYPQPTTDRYHFFIFHQQQLVAEWYGHEDDLKARAHDPQPHPIRRRYIYLGDQPVALIDYSTEQPRLYAIHSQFIGAPIAVSDDQQQFVWRAQYTALGAAELRQKDFYLPLRLPGHYADPVTGWHDNLLRTYDPERGHYLNPDPLGPAPGQQLLGYAHQRPWQWIDPMGLLLFAFDGTRYDARLKGNVWKFAQLYDETAYYQSGPGNSSYVDWDAVTAWRAHQIVQNQWQHLLNEMLWQDAGERLAIDIIGFSRGAALARHFGNEILQHTQQGWFHYEDDFGRQYAACLEPRFLGLFDTVAQFGLLGSHNGLYDLSVAPEWAWVAHAVALNEHRQLFPLYSIEADPDTPLDAQQVQAGFIGAHEDLGGGQSGAIPRDEDSANPSPGDLAHIPLAWMIWQAQSLGLAFADDQVQDLHTIEQPLLHDARPAYWRYLNTDRQVQTPTHSQHQWLHPEIGQSVRAEVEAFIERFEGWQKSTDNAVGTVDLEAYYQWLEQNLNWRPVPAS